MAEARNNIVFLSVPESLRGQFESMSHGHHHHDHEHEEDEAEEDSGSGFSIDPAIPIPVELPPGESSLDLEQLSWEMILSGMIRVISDFAGNHTNDSEISAEDADYYRHFVLAVKPDILEEFTEAAILKARNGDYDLALEITSALKGLFPTSPVVLLNTALILENRASALERSGREEEAEAEYEPAHQAYKDILALKPPFPDGLFNAGFFYMKRQNFLKARDCLSAYLSLEEGPEPAQLPRDKRDRAREIVREIESRSLDDELFRAAYDNIRLGEEQKGLEKIRVFLEQHPRVWNGWFILGWGLRRLSRWDDAAGAFTEAIELGGDNSDTRNELAICLMEQGKFKEARKQLETALREEPENVKIISNLGVLALRNGDDDEAAAFFRTVLELEPEDPVAKSYLQGEV
ncbi:tetratricopeptide repeat protein [Treponema primitia]|uniref:tetratricopeptide repeat protein n=1 Tax=Treponema primitia TaxID=88058 RepID=UPI0002DC8AE6|nr:tetratricopeptide repeat protein [Treponema primitia]